MKHAQAQEEMHGAKSSIFKERVELDKYCPWDLGCYYLVIGFRPQPLHPRILNGTSCLPE